MKPEEVSNIRGQVVAGLIVVVILAVASLVAKNMFRSGDGPTASSGGSRPTVTTSASSTPQASPLTESAEPSSTLATTSAPPPVGEPSSPPEIWPHIISEDDIKEGDPNLDGRSSGAGVNFATCVSFGTNGFQGTHSVTIYVPAGAKTFTATVGETKESDDGAITTRIELNGQTIASYEVSYYDNKVISIPVAGQNLLTLTVAIAEGGGSVPSNQAVLYGDARFNL
jgi:hypothetical protein